MNVKAYFGWILWSVIIICSSSCEKEIHLNMPSNTTEQVVVEGTISNGQPPVVSLTRNIGFFSYINLDTLKNLYLHDAVVKVSNGTDTITLKEYTFDTLQTQYSIYTVDANNLSFVGEVDKYYHLSVSYNNETYEATTTIPRVKPLDRIYAVAPANPPSDDLDAMEVHGVYSDPDTLGNRVRIFTKVNSNAFMSAFFDVYNDALINGTTVDLTIDPGYLKMDSIDANDKLYFHKGDTVIVNWAGIDYSTYTFWNTLEFSLNANGNPFSSPVQIISNISNKGLGIWSGYNNSYDTIVIPH